MRQDRRAGEPDDVLRLSLEKTVPLFRVVGDVVKDVGVVLDEKVETPVFRHPRLPPILAFVILLGAEGRMAEVLEQQQRLLAKLRLDIFGHFAVGPREMGGPAELHLAGRLVFLAESLAASLCRATGAVRQMQLWTLDSDLRLPAACC